MEVKYTIQGSKGAFYIDKDGRHLADMTFSMAGTGIMIIDHTEVNDSLRGTGAGKKMVAAAVKLARKENFKILPLCPFAKALMEKTNEWHDVLEVR